MTALLRADGVGAAGAAIAGRPHLRTSDRLRAALADAMDVVVLTDERGKELVAPVFKQILALRDQGVPEDTITALLGSLKRCCEFNAAVSVKAQTLCSTLDDLARAQHTPQLDEVA